MLEGLTPPSNDRLCAVMVAAADLDEKDYAILVENLNDARWTNNGLVEALNKMGFQCSESTVRKHRAKTCICAR